MNSGETANGEFDEIADFVSRLPQKPTPTNSLANQYEIKHTGFVNYLVSGGGTTIWIDGYRGDTILDAKFVQKPDISPYVPGSSCFSRIRENVAIQQASEFQRLANAIHDPNTPFNSVEVITNELAAVPYFEDWLRRFNIPGRVVVQP